jgi:protein O-mannosyl-transferase
MEVLGAYRGDDIAEILMVAARGPSRRRDVGVGVAIVLAAVAVAQGPAFLESFHRRHWEDRRFFVHSQTHISTIGECFTRPSTWPGLYRPLTTNCYYLLGRRLWRNRIEVYHAINLAFFAANGLLLLWLCLDWMPPPWAWLAGALFVSRLAHHELVANAVEFQVLASVFFALLALKLFLVGRRSDRRSFEALALLVFVLALLSKESIVVWPAILGLHGWLFDRPSAARRYLPPVLVAAAWALLLTLVIWPRVTPEPTGFAYDLSAAAAGRYVAYLLVFLNPLCWGLPRDTDMPPAVLRLAASRVAQTAFCVLVLAVGAAAWRWRRRPPAESAGRLAVFGLGWFLLAAAPYVILEDRLFMRYSYFPHAGLAVAVAALAWSLAQRFRRREGGDPRLRGGSD